MQPDPTISISWDYLVELADDGTQPDNSEPEVILLPPLADGAPTVTSPEENPHSA